MCSVFRAPREDNGEEDSEYSGIRPKTAEYVSSRALVGIQEYVFRFYGPHTAGASKRARASATLHASGGEYE